MIIVIADDITGAAEIAGTAHRQGLKASLLMGLDNCSSDELPKSDVIVVATDSRSMPEVEAANLLRGICKKISAISKQNSAIRKWTNSNGKPVNTIKDDDPNENIILYKKTDSVFRGHISLELSVIMHELGYRAALLIAQNPSKGRIIRDGAYYVAGTPLSETAFSHDPEYPALTSKAVELVGGASLSLPLEEPLTLINPADSNSPNKTCPPNGTDSPNKPNSHAETSSPYSIPNHSQGLIFIADATTTDEIDIQLKKADSSTLLAGGADAFLALLHKVYGEKMPQDTTTIPSTIIPNITPPDTPSPNTSLTNTPEPIRLSSACGAKLIAVCGSTQGKSLLQTPFMQSHESRDVSIPDDVFEGAVPDEWIKSLCREYAQSACLIMRIGDHPFRGAGYALRLKAVMAEATQAAIAVQIPEYLIIEGGATAFATLQRLSWGVFEVEAEYAPGVVGMRHAATHIILKPGSYPWGGLFGNE